MSEHCERTMSGRFTLIAQAYFCDPETARIPLHSPLPFKRFLECPLTALLPLTPFSTRSAPFPLTRTVGSVLMIFEVM